MLWQPLDISYVRRSYFPRASIKEQRESPTVVPRTRRRRGRGRRGVVVDRRRPSDRDSPARPVWRRGRGPAVTPTRLRPGRRGTGGTAMAWTGALPGDRRIGVQFRLIRLFFGIAVVYAGSRIGQGGDCSQKCRQCHRFPCFFHNTPRFLHNYMMPQHPLFFVVAGKRSFANSLVAASFPGHAHHVNQRTWRIPSPVSSGAEEAGAAEDDASAGGDRVFPR